MQHIAVPQILRHRFSLVCVAQRFKKGCTMETAALFISLGMIGYAFFTRNKTTTLIKNDDGFCKCKGCEHTDKCSHFVGKVSPSLGLKQ